MCVCVCVCVCVCARGCVCFSISKVTSHILILHAEDDSVVPYQLGQKVPPDRGFCSLTFCVSCLFVFVCFLKGHLWSLGEHHRN